jgi:hypothetical protein
MTSASRCSLIKCVLILLLLLSSHPVHYALSSRLAPTTKREEQQKSEQRIETLESLRARISAHLSQPRFAPAVWGGENNLH